MKGGFIRKSGLSGYSRYILFEVDNHLSTEDNKVVLSGNQYLGVVIFYIRLISGSNLI